MKNFKTYALALGLIITPTLLMAAAPVVPKFNQIGKALQDSKQLQQLSDAIKAIISGTSTGTYSGTFNGIVGGTTPAAGTFTSIVGDDITGGDASLGIAGLAAAQGGAVALVGGTSSTSGNAGGAVTLMGGTPGITGVGGAITITSGAGGATSGAAGNINLVANTATSANGSNITLTAGPGAGGTNAGGSVNLVPGAAVSTGAPGTIKVNGDSNLMCASLAPLGAPAAATDTAFYVATRPLLLVSVSEVHAVAAGGASALQVTKDSTTSAPGAGTDLLTNNTNTGFDLAATANTVQTGTLLATVATKTFAAGDRLSVDFANAIQSTSGLTVTACFAPL